MANTVDLSVNEGAVRPAVATRFMRVWTRLAETLEAERDRWFLWTPVCTALGIAAFFGLRHPPGVAWSVVALACGIAVFWVSRRRGVWVVAGAAALCAGLGFAAADLRTARLAAPVLAKPMTAGLDGRVLAAEWTETGALRTLIEVERLGRIAPGETPERARITFRTTDTYIAPGQRISAFVRLTPPPGPVEPAAFDFARQAWFQKLGAVGSALSAPEVLPPKPQSVLDAADARVQRLRSRIAHRVQDTVGGTAGAIAAALMTGQRQAIPEKARSDLRDTGLAHILAISGLHMALFAGALFWAVRAALVLVPHVALNYPVKKWAAIVALTGAAFYLVLSGASIATQRAFVTIAIMFLAILADRPALTMRNVALAALAILLWSPESLLSVSFQMSFAAVVALIAVYEAQQARLISARARAEARAHGRAGRAWGLAGLAGAYLFGLAVTSLVAGSATAPYAAFHFNRFADYGLAANLAAMPIVGFVVMPCALAAFLLMPLGLDGLALAPMGWGLDAVLWVADAVARWPGAVRLVPAAPLSALVLLTLGGLWVCLWQTRWRWAGALPFALGIAIWTVADRPDLLVERTGKNIGILNVAGVREIASPFPSYTVEIWLRRDGDARAPRDARGQSDHIACDTLGCIYREPGRPVVAYAKEPGALMDDCRAADIVVASFPVRRETRRSCRARLIVDRFDVWRNGPIAIWFDEARPRERGGKIVKSRDTRGERPWVAEAKRPKF